MPSAGDFQFGPYRLDLRSRRLVRAGVPVAIQPRQFDLLLALVSRPGELLTKNQLIETVWQGAFVTDNSLAQAISQLRGVLDSDDPARYIATAARLGYRFVAPVTRVEARSSDAEIDALLAPHRAALDGRVALEALQLDRVARARSTYEELLARRDDDPRSHVGLANACLEQFEATRADLPPDVEALRRAASHAREGVRLNLNYADAWATLGLALERTGDRPNALAALRRAVELEPNEWAHYLRLAWAGWGRERLSAARRMLELMPGSPAAHWLTATVCVARDALGEAERELDIGIAGMGSALASTEAYPSIALHWLKGLLLLARGADAEAMASFERELTAGGGHIYARETEANTWYAIGACHLRSGDRTAARAAFEQAIARVPQHAMAHAGKGMAESRSEDRLLHTDARDGAADPQDKAADPQDGAADPQDGAADPQDGAADPQDGAADPQDGAADPQNGAADLQVGRNTIDAALACAALLFANDDVPGAARVVGAALSSVPPGNAGWLIPIEPLLRVDRARPEWAPVLRQLRARAR